MPKPKDEPVPIPSTDSPTDHDRVRASNDRDQQLERDGKASRHNQGYDDAADGAAPKDVVRVVDEP